MRFSNVITDLDAGRPDSSARLPPASVACGASRDGFVTAAVGAGMDADGRAAYMCIDRFGVGWQVNATPALDADG